MNIKDIRIRDPFVLTDENSYFLYGTTDEHVWEGPGKGFDVYRSTDLVEWEGPYAAFYPEPGFWADRHFWAPEVHKWQNGYYMLASFKSENRCRGTQILTAPSPAGPFQPLTEFPVTPEGWECLDGTLFVGKKNTPWLVFCREWLQVQDGEMYAMPLSADLREPAGDPVLLFTASWAKWTVPVQGTANFVTDGPFLYEGVHNELGMIWSSRSQKGYAIGIARSPSGKVEGPWQHDEKPLVDKDGGHGMLFQTAAGEKMLALHSPNKSPHERTVFIPVKELVK